MNLIIDNSNLFAGGGIQVAISFLKDLKNLNLDHTYHVIQSPNMAKAFGEVDFPNNFKFYKLSENATSSKKSRIQQVKSLEDKIKPDCIFTVFGPSYHKSNYPKLVGFAIPHIIYPDSPYFKKLSIKDKLYSKLLAYFKSYCFKKYSDALVFETQDAANIYKEKYSFDKHIFIANNTLNEIFYSPDEWQKIPLHLDNTFNIVYLTANYPHKNLTIIPSIIEILTNKFNFHNFKFILTIHKNELNFPDHYDQYIKYIGKVNINQLANIYEQSNIAFIPTLLEVFSATYLEAMFMKRPIIASDLGFSRDICNNSAYFCEATNPGAYAEAIINLFNNPDKGKDLIEKGEINLKRFGTSLDRTRKYLNFIEQISNKK
ncbi:glycosyltransferase [Acinetobacter baumannii]|uniref:glycosyltransferase family 4 protein n=1 Tax=Acinetobacter baumannii TaxID=470 RepID=UPI00044B69A3|nr:glycosyltransferase [Acinetobacter baumannii]EXE79170.1 glycosyl transferases group 1 family protein [Acinetobacter baumannii 83444]MCF4467806.1 glycosyltransferase [Acinetobacter baumannii]MDV4228686.1 glycosyltransferase [Acinetobacter baumannii]